MIMKNNEFKNKVVVITGAAHKVFTFDRVPDAGHAPNPVPV